MTPLDAFALAMLMLVVIVIGTGAGFLLLVVQMRRRQRSSPAYRAVEPDPKRRRNLLAASAFHRPTCWLAIQSRELEHIQSALNLQDVRSCLWLDAFSDTHDRRLFVSPPVTDWILVTGAGLPDPREDVDVCFRFLQQLSRRLGHVQLFCADRTVNHHAWVRFERGQVIRAYAWAGRTLWHQGRATQAEAALGMRCHEYGETATELFGRSRETAVLNTDRVPMLAALWSVDPGAIEERFWDEGVGLVGERPRTRPL